MGSCNCEVRQGPALCRVIALGRCAGGLQLLSHSRSTKPESINFWLRLLHHDECGESRLCVPARKSIFIDRASTAIASLRDHADHLVCWPVVPFSRARTS